MLSWLTRRQQLPPTNQRRRPVRSFVLNPPTLKAAEVTDRLKPLVVCAGEDPAFSYKIADPLLTDFLQTIKDPLLAGLLKRCCLFECANCKLYGVGKSLWLSSRYWRLGYIWEF